jgi:non-lysosomal glucosylceramidase
MAVPVQRRDVLKILTAAPFLGLAGSRVQTGATARSGTETVWRVFEGPFLSEIAFPMGGIGTGTVSLGGRGQLRDWEICNVPDKGHTLDNTFFGLWLREGDDAPRTMVLESEIEPPYRGAFGIPRAGLPGMPRFQSARFLGSYPFARLELRDPHVPLDVSLEGFNPFIPGNSLDSGLPVAIFYWHLENRSRRRVEASLVASLSNIAGVDDFGGNVNRFVGEDRLRGIAMTTERIASNDPKFGSLALATTHTNVTYAARWERGEWFDAQSLFWEDFSRDGRLSELEVGEPSPEGRTDTGSIAALLTLEPGERASLPFLIAWHFPNRQNYWLEEIFGYEPNPAGPVIGNFYANHFESAWDAARYTAENLSRLESETRLFHDALFATTAPAEVLDAVSSQSSIIRTNTCFRTGDGNFYAFEGTGDDHGCCPLNCTHVWNYEQTLAYLFPELERTMREVDFLSNTDDEGFMVFRTRLPLETDKWDFPHAAADGQMGSLVKLYREWKLSGDTELLRRLWPRAKKALEFAWRDWDPDRDGVMEGVQHNTYDIEFRGPNPMMGTIYLTALVCASEMARAIGDTASASTYQSLYESGRDVLDRETWNGEFYVQAFERAREEKYQVGAGCLSDQMLGQWMAHVVGKGYVLPEDHVRSAIRSVYRYNFKESLADHANPQRIFALGDEGGLLLCSWPRGNRPLLPFVYSDEVWTGIEYQVAAHLIYEGDVEEGVRIVRAVRSRYDGERRNPWNEVECGNHYARALASWSLILALSGFDYSATERAMGFDPKTSGARFASFWSAGPGWGVYEEDRSPSRLEAKLSFLYGSRLELETFSLPAHGGSRLRVELSGEEMEARYRADGHRGVVSFASPVEMRPGMLLSLSLSS